jgi:hypothetical protein
MATNSPSASSAPALIVPMDVAGLLVSQEDVDSQGQLLTKQFASVAAAFDFTDRPYLGDAVLPTPFAVQSDDPLQPGIHLHFALPDSLARGSTDPSTGLVTFRPVPNRFLVVRIASRQDSQPPIINAWVVEGDYRWEPDEEEARKSDPRNRMSRGVPVPPDPNNVRAPLSQFQGRVWNYKDWSETADRRLRGSEHTALGYGVPEYSALYQHAPNTFGFYDPAESILADLGATFPADTGRLSYLIAAWYSNRLNDPLRIAADAVTTAKAAGLSETFADLFAAFLQQHYEWRYEPTADPVPDRTFCVGLLTNVHWDPRQKYLDAAPTAKPTIAIGPTVVEAFSALLASTRPEQQTVGEAILNAIQYGLVRNLESNAVDGMANFYDAVHERGYRTIAASDAGQSRPSDAPADLNTAGVTYVVKRSRPADSPLGAGNAASLHDSAAESASPLPADLAKALDDLNRSQGPLDRLSHELRVRRSQIFADWNQGLWSDESDEKLDFDSINECLHNGIADADQAAASRQTTLSNDRDSKMTTLTGLMRNAYAGQFVLQSVPAPRYYQPADPVLLFAGPDVNASLRHGGDGRYSKDGNLYCRLSRDVQRSSDLISSLTVTQDDGKEVSIDTTSLPVLPVSPVLSADPQLASDLAALLADALFMDCNLTRYFAGIAQPNGTGSLESMAGKIGEVQTRLITATQMSLAAGESPSRSVGDAGIFFVGVAPSPEGLNQYSPPWIPVLLQWEVGFEPVCPLPYQKTDKCYQVDWVSTFKFDSQDYVGGDSLPPIDSAESAVYQGTVVLANNADLSFKTQIKKYLEDHPDDPGKDELDGIANTTLPIMAQTLGGFHRALLMRKQSLQMPVFRALEAAYDPLDTNSLVSKAVKNANDAIPLPNRNYNPLRAGALTLRQLRLIDAFGQTREISLPGPLRPLIRAASFPAPREQPGGQATQEQACRVMLPLRITQPARLSFRYVAADAGSEEDGATQMNGDPSSTPVFGWILLNKLDNSLVVYDPDGMPIGSLADFTSRWEPAPRAGGKVGQSLTDSLDAVRPPLQGFVAALCEKPAGFLTALLETVDKSASRITPADSSQDDALALLIGRPFALVRADLSLELCGIPEVSQSLQSIRDASAGGQRYTAGFEKVRFPVRLGDDTRSNDGVVGFYIEDDPSKPFDGTLWAASAPAEADGIKAPPTIGAISVAAADAKRTRVTLIVDPRAPIHVSTGILPCKQIVLPPSQYVSALKRIAVTFLISPVLGQSDRLPFSLPTEAGYQWSWLTVDATRTWSEAKLATAPRTPGRWPETPPQIVEGWLRLFPSDSQSSHDK